MTAPPSVAEQQHNYRQALFFEKGLYEWVDDPTREHGGVFAEGVTHDTYCVDCRRPSTFELCPHPRVISNGGGFVSFVESGISIVVFRCTRNASHYITFALASRRGGGHMKVGQWPSLAKIGHGELRDYGAALSDVDREELAKAIGLHAHGVGAGAFVYLRRILERFVREAESEAENPESLDPRAKMVDRIKALKGALPDFLTDNKFIYSILSKGIHELPEETCRTAFPVVRSALELIVEERLARKRKAAAQERTRKNLSELQQQLESQDDESTGESE